MINYEKTTAKLKEMYKTYTQNSLKESQFLFWMIFILASVSSLSFFYFYTFNLRDSNYLHSFTRQSIPFICLALPFLSLKRLHYYVLFIIVYFIVQLVFPSFW